MVNRGACLSKLHCCPTDEETGKEVMVRMSERWGRCGGGEYFFFLMNVLDDMGPETINISYIWQYVAITGDVTTGNRNGLVKSESKLIFEGCLVNQSLECPLVTKCRLHGHALRVNIST